MKATAACKRKPRKFKTRMRVVWQECKAIKTLDMICRGQWLGSVVQEPAGWVVYVHKSVIIRMDGALKDLESAKKRLIEAAVKRKIKTEAE